MLAWAVRRSLPTPTQEHHATKLITEVPFQQKAAESRRGSQHLRMYTSEMVIGLWCKQPPEASDELFSFSDFIQLGASQRRRRASKSNSFPQF